MSLPSSSRARRRPPTPWRGLSVWIIALLVALVATVQIRSQAEVVRSLAQTDTTTLAFLIDDLHRANDALGAETADLNVRQAALQTGGSGAADEVLTEEASALREIEGLVPVHGSGIVMVIDASGLTALDLQDALNNLGAAGAEAISVNDQRVVTGVAVEEVAGRVTIGGQSISAPWTIAVIGDSGRLDEVASLMTQQLQADSRVRRASYRVEADVTIRAVVSAKPYVYAVGG